MKGPVPASRAAKRPRRHPQSLIAEPARQVGLRSGAAGKGFHHILLRMHGEFWRLSHVSGPCLGALSAIVAIHDAMKSLPQQKLYELSKESFARAH